MSSIVVFRFAKVLLSGSIVTAKRALDYIASRNMCVGDRVLLDYRFMFNITMLWCWDEMPWDNGAGITECNNKPMSTSNNIEHGNIKCKKHTCVYSCAQKTRVSSGRGRSLEREDHICFGVPSKRRPQPRANSVSPWEKDNISKKSNNGNNNVKWHYRLYNGNNAVLILYSFSFQKIKTKLTLQYHRCNIEHTWSMSHNMSALLACKGVSH